MKARIANNSTDSRLMDLKELMSYNGYNKKECEVSMAKNDTISIYLYCMFIWIKLFNSSKN